jgi:prepilin-type processing-associated H-X9-DG protein
MDFTFLYDPTRKLFAIGYQVDEGRLDPGYYDLLASEARLTSFIAIAKRDVPPLHWFKLGRRDGINNWPDPWNNHKTEGYNASFADGHAAWVKADAGLIRVMLDSWDEPPTNYRQVSPYRDRPYTYKGYSVREYHEP